MTDNEDFDENDHANHAHFISFASPQVIKERQDAERMANHAAVHGVHGLVSELNEGQLVNLKTLIEGMPGDLASHFVGIIKMHLHFRFAWCICGSKHMMPEDLLTHAEHVEMNGRVAEDIATRAASQDTDLEAQLRENYTGHWSEETPDEVIDRVSFRIFEEGQGALMDEYHLIPVSFDRPEVKCKLCGIQYPSLRDRMLRPADDCSGCRIKARNG